MPLSPKQLGGQFPARRQSADQWEGDPAPAESGAPDALDRQDSKENPALLHSDWRGLSDDLKRDQLAQRASHEKVGTGVVPPYPNLQPEMRPAGGESTVAFARVTITAAVYENAFYFSPQAPCSKLNLWVRKNSIFLQEHTSKYANYRDGIWGEEYDLAEGFLSIERRWLNGVRIRNLESGKNAEVTVVFVTAPQDMWTHQTQR